MLRSSITRLSKDVAVYGLSNLALNAISFFLVPIYTRIFSPGDYGVLDVIGTASSLLSLGLMLGISAAVFRLYNDYDEDGKDRLISTGFWYQLVTCLAVCTLAISFSNELSKLLFGSPRYSSFVAVALATIPFRAMHGMPVDLMRLNFQKLRYNILTLGSGVFQALLSIVLVVFLKKGLMGVFVSGFISAVLFSLLGIALIYRHIKLNFSFDDLRLLLGYGVPMVPASVSLWIMGASDRFFLVHMRTLHDVGLYSVGYKLAATQGLLFSAFQLAWSPIAYSMYREPGANRVFRKVFVYFLVLSSTLAMALGMFSPEVLRMLTPPAYHGAYKVVGLIALATVLHGVFYMGSMGVCFARKMKYYAYSNIIGALLNLALNFLLIPEFGMSGAAVATVISFAAIAYFGNYWGKKVYPLELPFSRVAVVAALYGIFCSLGLIVSSRMRSGALVAKSLLFLLFISAMCLLLEREERSLLNRLLGSAYRRVLGRARGKE